MGSTGKLYDYLGALAASLMIWEARGEGFVPEEIRREGQAAIGALDAIADEAAVIRRRITAQLAEAGHVPLAPADGTGPVKSDKPAMGADAHAIRDRQTGARTGH